MRTLLHQGSRVRKIRLTEEEFNKLSEAEKAAYNKAVTLHKKKNISMVGFFNFRHSLRELFKKNKARQNFRDNVLYKVTQNMWLDIGVRTGEMKK